MAFTVFKAAPIPGHLFGIYEDSADGWVLVARGLSAPCARRLAREAAAAHKRAAASYGALRGHGPGGVLVTIDRAEVLRAGGEYI